jgi:hypothetical protein
MGTFIRFWLNNKEAAHFAQCSRYWNSASRVPRAMQPSIRIIVPVEEEDAKEMIPWVMMHPATSSLTLLGYKSPHTHKPPHTYVPKEWINALGDKATSLTTLQLRNGCGLIPPFDDDSVITLKNVYDRRTSLHSLARLTRLERLELYDEIDAEADQFHDVPSHWSTGTDFKTLGLHAMAELLYGPLIDLIQRLPDSIQSLILPDHLVNALSMQSDVNTSDDTDIHAIQEIYGLSSGFKMPPTLGPAPALARIASLPALRSLDISRSFREDGGLTLQQLECIGRIPTLTHFSWCRGSSGNPDPSDIYQGVVRTDLFNSLQHLTINVIFGGPSGTLTLFAGAPLQTLDMQGHDDFNPDNDFSNLQMPTDAIMFAPFVKTLLVLRLEGVTANIDTPEALQTFVSHLPTSTCLRELRFGVKNRHRERWTDAILSLPELSRFPSLQIFCYSYRGIRSKVDIGWALFASFSSSFFF